MTNFSLIRVTILAFLLLSAVVLHGKAQADQPLENTAWITVDSGHAVYLDPHSMEWVPVSEKQRISLKTYLLTDKGARLTLFHQTDIYEIPPSGYLFLEDVLKKDHNLLVKSLTQIEAEQLPLLQPIPGDRNSKKIGVTYGSAAETAIPGNPVPFESERFNAVQWFEEQGREDVSLLLLKRIMTQYPILYREEDIFNRLCTYYEKLELFGFLHNETQKIMQMDIDEELKLIARNWKERAERQFRYK